MSFDNEASNRDNDAVLDRRMTDEEYEAWLDEHGDETLTAESMAVIERHWRLFNRS